MYIMIHNSPNLKFRVEHRRPAQSTNNIWRERSSTRLCRRVWPVIADSRTLGINLVVSVGELGWGLHAFVADSMQVRGGGGVTITGCAGDGLTGGKASGGGITKTVGLGLAQSHSDGAESHSGVLLIRGFNFWLAKLACASADWLVLGVGVDLGGVTHPRPAFRLASQFVGLASHGPSTKWLALTVRLPQPGMWDLPW
ncbi:hypothetical protein GGX14DRAFT_387601 [Mycena pura]|uniref:Uncharacterized protein n=1 Tax=Mycena pura TaxID=153505 RepID=A0AAD6YM51_9AGAR|nr:hypothetical protein GGX14DRAFT_387601 [Mycena pura]